jgi:hypothetical protein
MTISMWGPPVQINVAAMMEDLGGRLAQHPSWAAAGSGACAVAAHGTRVFLIERTR